MLDKNIIANTASTIWQPFGSSGKQVTTCNQSEPVKNTMCPFCHTMPQPQWPPKGTPQTTESQDMQRLPCNAAYVSTGSKAFNTTISKTTISTTRDYKESQGRNTKPRGCEGGPRQRPGTTEGTMFRVSLSITTKATTRIFRKWPSAAYNIAKILFKGKDEPPKSFSRTKKIVNLVHPNTNRKWVLWKERRFLSARDKWKAVDPWYFSNFSKRARSRLFLCYLQCVQHATFGPSPRDNTQELKKESNRAQKLYR